MYLATNNWSRGQWTSCHYTLIRFDHICEIIDIFTTYEQPKLLYIYYKEMNDIAEEKEILYF